MLFPGQCEHNRTSYRDSLDIAPPYHMFAELSRPKYVIRISRELDAQSGGETVIQRRGASELTSEHPQAREPRKAIACASVRCVRRVA